MPIRRTVQRVATCTVLLIFSTSLLYAQQPVAADDDVASIDAIVGALYDVISGGVGEERDWDRMRSLFVPGGRLIPAGGQAGSPPRANMLSVDDWIERTSQFFVQNGFFEQEIGRELDQFGAVAHAFSAYESRRSLDDAEPFSWGINSIQLLNDGTRWWIVNVFWDPNSARAAIPEEYRH